MKGRKGGRAKSAAKQRASQVNGRKGGRPPNPAVLQIMAERGCTRQRAWQVLKAAAINSVWHGYEAANAKPKGGEE